MKLKDSKKLLAFWVLATFFQGLLSQIPFLETNFFLAFCFLFSLRVQHLSTSFIYIIFGFTLDCYSTGLFGSYALSFFLTSFLAFGLVKIMDRENWIQVLLFGFVLGVSQEVIHLFLILIFEDTSFWGIFLKEKLFSKIILQSLIITIFSSVYFRFFVKN